MKILKDGCFTGERALYYSSSLDIRDSVFCDGESPLKESRDIKISGCIFKWKYPLWYSENIEVTDSTLLETARSGIWYTRNISIKGSTIDAPKTFRRASGIHIEDCTMPHAQESFWNCSDITIKNLSASGDYFGMGAENVRADGFYLSGNYAFDGAKNVEIRNSRLVSKDAFWNTENVTVYDSVIIGEYLGWNSKNLRLVNCTVESNQGMCYIEDLVMVNCKTPNTDLAFEFCTVDADIVGPVMSIKNPISGRIWATSVGEIILDENLVDVSKTEIVTEDKSEI